MNKEPDEMTIEELDAIYGKPKRLPVITHVLGQRANVNHDRILIEVATEDAKRLEIPFTQTALKSLVHILTVFGDLAIERPKAN